MGREDNKLYEALVEITYRYLGPAADRFVLRQCKSHLKKEPQQLVRKDLKELVVWFSLAMGTLSEDPEVVKQFESELNGLTRRAR